MILFFDTETTGLYRDRLPFDHPDQPRLVQLAAILTDDAGETLHQVSVIVNPGAPIPKQASDVHGITDEIAQSIGFAEKTAAALFRKLAEDATTIVAHNIAFDEGVMLCAAARHGVDIVLPREHQFCTMTTSAPIVNLPPTDRMRAAGFNKPKPPRLEECIKHFFGEGLDGAHDALVDVQACARVFFHLKSMEQAA